MILRRLLGRKRTKRVAVIAAKHWNQTRFLMQQDRKEIALANTKDELGGVFTSILLSIAVKIAIKMIEKWAEENLFSVGEGDLQKWTG